MLKLQHALPCLLLTACAVRQPGPRTWRFTERTLIPPGVVSANLSAATFKAPVAIRRNCLDGDALTVERRRSSAIVTVHRDALLKQPRGWLTAWTERAESEGCLQPGQAALLSARILESLPLPAGAANRLLRADGMPNFVEIGAGNRLQVISPLLRPGAGPAALVPGDMRVSGSGNRVEVEIQSSPDLIGVETAWYDLQPKPSGRGFAIVPVSVEVNLRGVMETRDAPVTNYFQFPPEIGYYRLFYKADQTEVLASAATRAALPVDPDRCPSCLAIPRGVGVNPYLRVMVNGALTAAPIGASLRAILQSAKVRPEIALPSLTILKPFAGRPVPIEFDHARQDILNLVLAGDEEIRWK